VVVGAGHIAGIKNNIVSQQAVEELLEIPPKSVWPTVFKWAVPAAIIAIIVYGFFKGGAEHSLENILIWILVNGILSAAGAAAALGHPVTLASAFLSAPITSLNPMIGAGWVAGLVQAWIRKPTVEDFEMLSEATATLKGFWTNPVTKILLVAAFANLGSVLGTYLAAVWIASRTL
jgi:pheromone shutdown-related protein TraB